MVRTDAEAEGHMPERLELGGRHPNAVTIGRHKDNQAVVELPLVSKLHCQVTLRGFRLPHQGTLHEAAFLHDVSKHGTFVNGSPAFRPWHWLQAGDVIGFRRQEQAADPVIAQLYRVEYWSHQLLPGHMVTVEDMAGRGHAPSSNPRHSGAVLAASTESAASAKEGVRRSSRLAVAARRAFGAEIVGSVVDVTYPAEEGGATYRVRVTEFKQELGWHEVDSEGLSAWDDESFQDEINLNEMYALGSITFVFVEESADSDVPLIPPSAAAKAPRKRAPAAAPSAAAATQAPVQGRPKRRAAAAQPMAAPPQAASKRPRTSRGAGRDVE